MLLPLHFQSQFHTQIAVKPPLNRQWFRAQIRRIGFCSDGSGGRVLIAEVLYIDAGDVQRVGHS